MIRAKTKEDWVRMTDNRREFEANNRVLNAVRFNSGSTHSHEMKKAEICFALQAQGHAFITEGVLTRARGRVDVCDLTEGVIFEVMESESDASIEEKRKRYPFPIVCVGVETEKIARVFNGE